MRYHRLSLLWDTLVPDFVGHGHFLASLQPSSGEAVVRRAQSGVVRTNCVDCLDRTNVTQGVLGRKALEEGLKGLGLLAADGSLPSALPGLEKRFKVLWADHGDVLSRQYAGTGAMKSGYTRTGKRTAAGVVDDGVKSVARYYLNSFCDGAKQDALDVVAGAFVPDAAAGRLKLGAQYSPVLPLLAALAALMVGAANASRLAQGCGGGGAGGGGGGGVPLIGGGGRGGPEEDELCGPLGKGSSGLGSAHPAAVFKLVVAPVLLAVTLVAGVVKFGKHLVAKPRLCPQLYLTVPPTSSSAAAGGEAGARRKAD